ncbi:reverse transcriptase domain-containing protein [Tanacetum coccineum]|uniref:Reverse transcriptase domain-containing protein n=1 Tax=Tanacetum coccineum TaxID=301880 RepID=A0ABQ4WNY8_9ASTR
MPRQGRRRIKPPITKMLERRAEVKWKSLNRFLAKSAEKSLPFFKTLKKCTKKSDFLWTEEAEAAFKQMKEAAFKLHSKLLPMLTAPEEQEELIVYLAASKEAVSAVLMTEREARQMPIYFVSRALRGPKVNYTVMEKLVLALVHASKRLRRYFQAYPITVITDQPIKNILSNPEVAGGCKVELKIEGSLDDSAKEEEPLPARWTLFTDGSSCVDGCGAGVILTDPEGVEFTYALRFQFETTNNEAEYEALIAGLRIAEKMGVKNLEVNVDSKLVANQVNGTYIAKETDMIKYLEKVKALTSTFRAFSIKQVPRSKNKKADALSKMASTSFAHLSKQVLVEELKEKSVNEREVLTVVEEEGDTWITPIHEYLMDETLPAERKKARAIKRPLQQTSVLQKYTKGSCRCSGTRSVVAKALRNVIYWRDNAQDARALIKACPGMSSAQNLHWKSLRTLEEKPEQAAIREAKSKRQMEKYYNTKVRNASFKPGDLVYQSNEASRVEDTGKLGPKWEGPYEVTEALGKGSYKLKDRNGKELPRTRNVCNLKKCYIHKV